jgi:hypothetical protein
MKIFKAGMLYFVFVFGAGFVLGPIRILWAVPRFGTRMSELLEMPIMLVVIILAAWWIARRLDMPHAVYDRLGMGFLALGLLLAAEFALVGPIQGFSIREYLANRDPVSGTVYNVVLVLFALMPFLITRKEPVRPVS